MPRLNSEKKVRSSEFSGDTMFDDSPDSIPPGWTVHVKEAKSGRKVKCYLDPSTGYRFYSKPDVFRYLETINQSNFTSTQKQVGPSMPSPSKVVVERSTEEGLPTGWIKEIKISMKDNRIRKDPYYTDPVSGYVFRSRKDVFRYLKTGSISRHAFKPKNKSSNIMALANDETSQPPKAKRQELVHQKTMQSLLSAASADTGHSCMSNLSLPEIQDLRKTKQLSSEAKFALEHPAETLQKTVPGKNKRYAESMKCSSSRSSDVQKKRKSKTTGNALPFRSSKRLAGLKPGMVDNSGSSEQVLAHKMSGKSEVSPAPAVIMGSLDSTACCQLEVVLQVESRHYVSKAVEAPSNVERSKKDHRYFEGEAAQEKEAVKLGTVEKTSDVQESAAMDFPSADVWSDPCLEFAFKTLTGAIPIEDNLDIEGYFQQQFDTAHAQNSSLRLPEFGFPTFHFDEPEKSAPVQQCASKPINLPQQDESLSACSGISHPQCALEGSKEHPTRVN